MSPAGAWARAGLVMVAVIALDQATKALVRSNVAIGDSDAVLPAVQIVHVRNEGVAFSRFSGGGTVVSIIVGAALLALLVYFVTHLDKPLVWLPTGMLLGGALGNVIDRVRDGAVTDFIKLPAVAGLQRRRHLDHLRRPRAALRHRAPASCSGERRLRTPARGSTPSWPAPLGSRARAQRLIEAGHVLVDGRAAPKRHRLSAGELVDGRRARGGPGARRRPTRPTRCPTRTSTCSWSTSPPASSCTRRAGTARARSRRRSARSPPAARTPRAPGSCTAWIATPRACSSWRARRRCTARCARAAGARDHARVPGAGRGAPAGAQRHDRCPARARPARADADVDRHRRSRARR